MSTLADSGFPNLAEWQKRQKPGGGVAELVNTMSKVLPELDDIPWKEGNLPTGHRITQVTGLPSPSWRKLNSGVAATKDTTEQFDETCGILEDESKVDVDHAKLNGDEAAYRASRDKIKQEAFAQTFATALFYESVSTNPERIHGLTPRYPATTGFTSSGYTLAGTNAGTNAHSIWLITWDLDKVYGIYPKGSMAGLTVEDIGKQRVLDASSNSFMAYCTRMQWKCGIAVEDYRYLVRAQWDPDDADYADNEKGVYLLMRRMLNTIYRRGGTTRFYMDRTTKTKLDAQLASNDVNPMSWAHPKNEDGSMAPGHLVPMFDGVPIRVTDALVAETAIS